MTKSEENRVELIQDFIKEMRVLDYSDWYIGKQIALIIWTLDTLKSKEK